MGSRLLSLRYQDDGIGNKRVSYTRIIARLAKVGPKEWPEELLPHTLLMRGAKERA